MIIVKTPFRISFFGGSTDYESFYKEHGSFIIGTTIDKYVWLSARARPHILPKVHTISYSKQEVVSSPEQIQNPLIREVMKYSKLSDFIDFSSSIDVPSRTGLGGSSTFCVGMIHLLKKLRNKNGTKKEIAQDAINVERKILKESGGIQDQIWASYGGFNTITIDKKGNFKVKPIPVSKKFKKDFESSIILIYTNNQRDQDSIAQSHENKDKKKILELSKMAYAYFLDENIEKIGKLLYESWQEKRKISPLVSTEKIDTMVDKVMSMGAYGVKLLGSGGCGFLLVISKPSVKKEIINEFKDSILEIKFEDKGTSVVYPKQDR